MPSPIPELVAKLCLYGYPGAPKSPELQRALVATLAHDLADVPEDELAEACAAFVRSTDPGDRYMPTPGRLIALTPSHRRMEEAESRAGERFGRALRALLGGVGAMELARMQPAAITAELTRRTDIPPAEAMACVAGLRAVGDWRHLGSTDADQLLRHGERAFREAYCRTLRELTASRMPALTEVRGGR